MSNKKTNAEDTQLQDQQTLLYLLLKTGFTVPLTEKEVEEYNRKFGTTDVELPEELANPTYIKEHFKEANRKPVKNDYFKKIVLAAHIANELHAEYTFGRIKFVKLIYLCEEVCEMKLSTCYGKYAAGPLDPKLIYSIDAEFKKRKWFSVSQTQYGYKYSKDVNAEDYKQYYLNYYKSSIDTIDRVINLLRKAKTDFCEIVATLFFVWKENVNKNQIITDSLLITHFYNWSEKKKRFKQEELKNAIIWMEENQIVPIH